MLVGWAVSAQRGGSSDDGAAEWNRAMWKADNSRCNWPDSSRLAPKFPKPGPAPSWRRDKGLWLAEAAGRPVAAPVGKTLRRLRAGPGPGGRACAAVQSG